MVVESKSSLRTHFFEMLFGSQEGFVCLATTHPDAVQGSFRQEYFNWPFEHIKMENFILKYEPTHNVYYCINLLVEPRRIKENCLPTDLVWADLDTVDPAQLKIPPSISISSSRNRWQGIWRLTTKLPPFEAQDYSKRVAYAFGADKSGWDLTQLLRVPFTFNHKYHDKPEITIELASEARLDAVVFDLLPQLASEDDPILMGRPTPLGTDESIDQIIYKYQLNLKNTPFAQVYSFEPSPEDDWSKVLWRLIHICLEAGMTAEETFLLCKTAPSNKYARDGRPEGHLWKDVLKAEAAQNNLTVIATNFRQLVMPQLVSEPATETFIDQYRDWASEATDAVVQFHDLSAFIMLSAIVANSVRLHTSHSVMVPNIWGLILGDSTLARKTTAMRAVMDILNMVDPELLLATDGSAEGLLTGLSMRPSRVSIFFKDEVSGFFESINRKDYLAGLPETMTQLYDVPAVLTRMLRKETIRIERPAFIFFGGGVRDKVYDSLTQQYILSGFLPRFLVVSGDTDMSRIRATGPAHEVGMLKRANLVERVAEMYEDYGTDVTINVGGQKMQMPPLISAELTPDAWEKYQKIEMLMVTTASESHYSDLALPTLDRLSRSLLKLAIILGAERQHPKDEKISITIDDIDNASWYIQDWGRYSLDLVLNAGKRMSERIFDKIVKVVDENPGILRSTIMQHYHLTKRETDEVLGTLEDRQMIRAERAGRGIRYFPS